MDAHANDSTCAAEAGKETATAAAPAAAAACKASNGVDSAGQQEQEQESLLFVYGTLKMGQPNEPVMLDTRSGRATLIGKAITAEKWPLVIASRYNVPYLLNVPGCGHVSRSVRRSDRPLLHTFTSGCQ